MGEGNNSGDVEGRDRERNGNIDIGMLIGDGEGVKNVCARGEGEGQGRRIEEGPHIGIGGPVNMTEPDMFKLTCDVLFIDMRDGCFCGMEISD